MAESESYQTGAIGGQSLKMGRVETIGRPDYRDIVLSSIIASAPRGMTDYVLSAHLREHQRAATAFALEQGRAALFLDTGLGKSLCSFAWADNVARKTGKPVLMLAPLGVVGQHKKEAEKFGFSATICREAGDIKPGINLANYERLHLFNPDGFGGLILDESSVIKNFSGVVTRRLMEFGRDIPFRLCCTATPAPNDHMELGQHAQFLGIMSSSEMLSRWFIADQSEMGRYRLKRHAVKNFWQWVASWARCAERPSDLGGDDTGYILPPLNLERHIVRTDITVNAGDDDGQNLLFRIPSNSATSIHREKRMTADDRAAKIASLVIAEPDEPWLIWCETDYDANAVRALIANATEVHGRMNADQKEAGLAAFTDGSSSILITKPSIAGWGLNWQHCRRVAFVGLSFSYESFYQAVRRCWRYGQTMPVNVHVACAETEEAIWQTIVRKRDDHDTMKIAMREAMANAFESRSTKHDYQPKMRAALPAWLQESVQ
jgi:hypothetical protein